MIIVERSGNTNPHYAWRASVGLRFACAETADAALNLAWTRWPSLPALIYTRRP